MNISVIVPVRNEEQSIATLLQALLEQTQAPAEIVICDTGSTDRTVEIIERFTQQGAPVRLLRVAEGLPGRGRNVAAANASHEWLAFIDAGTRPDTDWLERLAARTERDPDLDVLYGGWEPVTETFFKECAAIAYVPPHVKTDEGLVRPLSIASALIRRNVWEGVGGFPEDLRSAEDLLFMRKIAGTRFRSAREPSAVVHWNIQPNLWRTFRRFVTYSRNNIRAGLWREWQAAIFLRYAFILGSAIPAVFFGWWWLIISAGLWLGMMIARAAKSIERNRASYPAGFLRNAGRVLVLVPILAAIDAAALVGAIDWLVRDKFGLGKTNQ